MTTSLRDVQFTDMTGEQWLDVLLAQSREKRIDYCTAAVAAFADTAQGHACYMQDHDRKIKEAQAQSKALMLAIQELRDARHEMSDAALPAVEAVLNRIERTISIGNR